MAKKHILSSNKQYSGQYYTTKANEIFAGWENLVKSKDCIDPFCGNFDLLNWCKDNGANSIIGYDFDSKIKNAVFNNSLLTPPDYTDKFVVSNPPFLAANKCRSGDRTPYKLWKQSDYYKCHLASLYPKSEEGLLILPSNFLCESNSKARTMFFENYEIKSAKFWNVPIFEDATTGITAFHYKKKKSPGPITFPCTILPENKTIIMTLEKEYEYLHGQEFLKYISTARQHNVKRTITGQIPNTKIIVGCLDFGKYSTGFHYNKGSDIIVKPTVITTYQLSIDVDLSDQQQKQIIAFANKKLLYYRHKYDSMFLSNYLGAKQKILSFRYVNGLISKSVDDLFGKTLLDYVSKTK